VGENVICLVFCVTHSLTAHAPLIDDDKNVRVLVH